MSGLEIELKAAVAPQAAATLSRRLTRMTGKPATRIALAAIYYDTADRRLAKAGIALRVRREGGRLVQTLKAGRSQTGGFHAVREVNVPVSKAAPDLSAIPDGDLRDRVEALLGKQALQARFETRVSRRIWQVQAAHGLVEVALDRGEIRSGQTSESVSEVEFELLGGSPQALFQLAADLLGDRPADLSLPNKAARGEALAAGKPRRARPISGKPGTPVAGSSGEACWRAAIASAAIAVATNLWCLQVGDEPEGPHQLRVALRRLRAAERLHRPLLSDEVSAELSAGAREMGRLVAPLRDSDVLTAELCAANDDPLLTVALAEANARTRAEVRTALRRSGATSFAIRLVELAAIGGWRPPERRPDQPVDALARRTLKRLWARASALGDKLSTLSDEERHEFRKLLKKLRYALDLAPSSPEKRTFTSALKKLQSDLGTLNDIAVLEGWSPDVGPDAADALDAAHGRLLKAARDRGDLSLGRACRHWRDLRAEARPWPARR